MPNASGDEVLPEHVIFRFELIGEFPTLLLFRPVPASTTFALSFSRHAKCPSSNKWTLRVSPTLFPR
jgi:hypothetical protein